MYAKLFNLPTSIIMIIYPYAIFTYMTNRLIKTTHIIVLSALLLIIVASIGNYFNMTSLDEGELGSSLGFATIYLLGLILGFIGWLLAIAVLVRRNNTLTHKVFALVYIIIGLIGFAIAYYFMQAS
jgi:hypothetical protein